MTATTYTHFDGAKSGKSVNGASIGDWFSRVFWRIAEAQEKAARERVARHFRGLNDDYLEKLGYSASDINRIRRG